MHSRWQGHSLPHAGTFYTGPFLCECKEENLKWRYMGYGGNNFTQRDIFNWWRAQTISAPHAICYILVRPSANANWKARNSPLWATHYDGTTVNVHTCSSYTYCTAIANIDNARLPSVSVKPFHGGGVSLLSQPDPPFTTSSPGCCCCCCCCCRPAECSLVKLSPSSHGAGATVALPPASVVPVVFLRKIQHKHRPVSPYMHMSP